MHFVRRVGTATLFLLLGALVPVYAQHGRGHEGRGNGEGRHGGQQQGRDDRGGPRRSEARGRQRYDEQRRGPRVERQQHQRVQHSEHPRAHAERYQPGRSHPQAHRSHAQAAAWQHERGWLKHGGWHGHDTWQQSRARRWEAEHRPWFRRGGYGGYYIPHDHYIRYFGPRHWFRMHTRPVIYLGYPRFEYGGFSFLLVDPWPEYWEEDWYDTDDVYIDYDGGYYLHNRRHPGIRLAVTVAL